MAEKGSKTKPLEVIAAPTIEKRIFVVRGRQVMLDEDLADPYGVETKRLVEQVKRNLERPRRATLRAPSPQPKRPIGFRVRERD